MEMALERGEGKRREEKCIDKTQCNRLFAELWKAYSLGKVLALLHTRIIM